MVKKAKKGLRGVNRKKAKVIRKKPKPKKPVIARRPAIKKRAIKSKFTEMSKIAGPRFCPICKSSSVAIYAGFVSANYKCKNCGYVGNFFLEKFKKIKKF